MNVFEGGCHCGRVRFRVRTPVLAGTDCNCSMCTKKGILHLIVPREQFEVLQGEGELTTYTFNTGVAKHTFCRHCGIHPFYVPRSDPDKVDVNIRCIDGIELDKFEMTPFDGKNWEQSMHGRKGLASTD